MLLKVVILGIIQGLTEFLPVSSTAHLIIVEKILGVSEESFGLPFDISLHIGTTLALVVFFQSIWKKLFVNLFSFSDKFLNRLMLNLIIATIPTALIGLFLENDVKKIFRSPVWIGVFLIIFSFVFLLAEITSKKKKEMKDMSIMDALIIGFNQSVALLPGVSRSGITISGGLLLDFKREEAGKFAFLLSTPVIIAAFLKEHGQDIFRQQLFSGNPLFFLGAIVSFIVGIITLKFFLNYLNKGSLIPFVVYRIILGLAIFFLIGKFL